MMKADAHVHSKFSDHPSEWFLQRIGTAESYTEPDFIYQTAVKRGMDFVVITDHNNIRGAMYLKEKYPDKVFTGVEATAYFPEDGCKVHILIYGITETNFIEIEKLRINIYELRDYLRDNDLAYSIAHATYSVNNKISGEHLEKLILLFDVFEGLNGARDKIHNNGWMKILKELTPEDIGRLKLKHGIDPISDTPWIKSFTGGSDDHAGIFIGKTYTLAFARTPEEFLDSIRYKKSIAEGRHNNFQSLAFTIYKIAYDFSKTKSTGVTKSFISQITNFVFEENRLSFLDKIKINRIKSQKESRIKKMLVELVEEVQRQEEDNVEKKLELVYDKVSEIADEFLRILTFSLEENLKEGNIVKLIKNISLSLPGIFLSIPFLSTFQHMHSNKHLLQSLSTSLCKKRRHESKRILWFTDTLNDLNGVSITLKKIGWLCSEQNREMKIVTSLLPDEQNKDIPPIVINLPASYSFKLPYYEKIRLKIPSILTALKNLYEFDPDEIIISTPGPVGLLGLLIGKLLKIKCSGVYHTDFTKEVAEITQEEGIASMIEAYTKWFYSVMDEIRVPTEEYIHLLIKRGFDPSRMTHFGRGIDTGAFSPRNGLLKEQMGIKTGINLLFAGRVSKDKNLAFLSNVYENLSKKIKKVNLIIVGDGPYLPVMKKRFKDNERVLFTGAIANNLLPEIYSFSDILVFPSTTDTFGMVVLEAQSCGLPAIVSDTGGPKEIIENGKTGWALNTSSAKEWEEKIIQIIDMIHHRHSEYTLMRNETRRRVIEKHSWNEVLSGIFEDKAYKNNYINEVTMEPEFKNDTEPGEISGNSSYGIKEKLELLSV